MSSTNKKCPYFKTKCLKEDCLAYEFRSGEKILGPPYTKYYYGEPEVVSDIITLPDYPYCKLLKINLNIGD